MTDLKINVNDLIKDIHDSISKDLMSILNTQAPLLISVMSLTSQSMEIASQDVENFQIALNLIGNFA